MFIKIMLLLIVMYEYCVGTRAWKQNEEEKMKKSCRRHGKKRQRRNFSPAFF